MKSDAANVPVHAEYLWYLLAITYVYIIFYFVTRHDVKEKTIFAVSFLLLFLNLLLGEFLSAFDVIIPVQVVRNFALMGVPFFALGLLARKNQHKLRDVPNYILIIAAATGAVESIFSRFCFGRNELYLGSLFVLFALVVAFIKYSNVRYPCALEALSGCSLYIYIFHIMVSSVIVEIYERFGVNLNSSVILINIHPILVCVVSTILALLIRQITRRMSSGVKAE